MAVLEVDVTDSSIDLERKFVKGAIIDVSTQVLSRGGDHGGSFHHTTAASLQCWTPGRQAERYLQNHFADCLFPKEDPRSILQKKVIAVPVNGVNH